MPAKKGGKRAKRGKKTTVIPETVNYAPFADPAEGQAYGLALKMLGNRRLTVRILQDKGGKKVSRELMCIIPGKFKGRRNWISPGMIVMVHIRDFQDDKVDVSYVYKDPEAKFLRRKGELDDLLGEGDDEHDGVIFQSASAEPKEKEEEIELDSEESIDLEDL